MHPEKILQLDPVVHAPVRLAILSILITVEGVSFGYLKEATGSSDGNLSTHLTKLESSGYIRMKKTFVDRRPQTMCSITDKGKKAFLGHLERLEKIVAEQKETKHKR